jgi:O-antigen/teichoic acid export membrane protein
MTVANQCPVFSGNSVEAANTNGTPVRPGGSLPPVWARFLGYLSADGLTYLLGFAIYGWLIRILADRQYGQLSVATSIYQVLMVLGALGLDLIGPRLIAEAGGNSIHIVERGQWIRLTMSLGVCAPATIVLTIVYWQRGQPDVAALILAGFAMVLARTVDVSYLAVALGRPGALARTRTVGLGLYLALLLMCKPVIVRWVWIIPLLNATGMYAGRVLLLRILRRHTGRETTGPLRQIQTGDIVYQGVKASSGMLLLLAYQTLDIVLLAKYVPAQSVGQYAMVSRLYLFGTAVLACLLNTFLPELVAAAKDGDLLARRFRRFALASACIGVLGAALFWIVGPWACETLGHRHLAVARQVAPFYALLFLVMAICNPFLSLLPSLHRSGAYVGAIAGAAAMLGSVDLFLIPRFGPVGAALGQLVATSFLALVVAAIYLSHVRGLNRIRALIPASTYISLPGLQ